MEVYPEIKGAAMCGKIVSLLLLLALPWGLPAQESPLDTSGPAILENLRTLDDYLSNIEANSTEQQKELQALRQAIADSMGISEAQAEMLKDLRASQDRQSAIQERQAGLLRKSLYKSKALSLSLIVGVPAVIAGTALLTWRLCK
jgi:hypothetical protein